MMHCQIEKNLEEISHDPVNILPHQLPEKSEERHKNLQSE
jgi:hypothetical protein